MTSLLAAQGLLEDQSIPDEERRKAQQERLQKLYHNTRVLLSHYREIAWVLECFPETVAQELEEPFENLDTLLDRINDALTVLKKKPGNGPRLYELIYLTYIAPEKLSLTDLLFRLDLSSRQYYRLREEAVSIISIRLWSVPEGELKQLAGFVEIMEG